ncbi:MAG: hypothetical protein RI920_2054 [Pseudomonadota bacterium]|jgi:hypothetical protein
MPNLIQGPLHINTERGGIAVEHDGADHVTLDVHVIREVGVASLAEVLAHDIVQVAGLVSHIIRLINGGQVNFAFNQAGQVVALSGARAQLQLTTTHSLSIRALQHRELP